MTTIGRFRSMKVGAIQLTAVLVEVWLDQRFFNAGQALDQIDAAVAQIVQTAQIR